LVETCEYGQKCCEIDWLWASGTKLFRTNFRDEALTLEKAKTQVRPSRNKGTSCKIAVRWLAYDMVSNHSKRRNCITGPDPKTREADCKVKKVNLRPHSRQTNVARNVVRAGIHLQTSVQLVEPPTLDAVRLVTMATFA
jgi:hypothetical protein